MSLSSIFTIPTFLLAVSINVLMLIVRRVCELIWPSLASHTPRTLGENVWERLVLPTLPAVLGALFCVLVPPASDGALSGFAYPAVVTGSVSRILYGVGTGFFSSYLYGVFKFLLKKEWNIDLPFPGDSVKPPPNPPVKPGDELLAPPHEKGEETTLPNVGSTPITEEAKKLAEKKP